MLHAIELGHTTWPKAILYGVVNVLAKNDGAAPVDRFRPVVIFSVIYRTRAVGQSSLKTIASLAHSEDGRGSLWLHAWVRAIATLAGFAGRD
jgi:hypothetical protein